LGKNPFEVKIIIIIKTTTTTVDETAFLCHPKPYY
jgi:hypothetical protein